MSLPFTPAAVASLRALTLDLDDTLWPIGPVIERAERVLHDWLLRHAPATAQRYPVEAMRALRAEIGRRHPEWAHDLTELRLRATHQALQDSGDDPALAQPAFELFFAERQKVEFYPEVAAALDRLAARWPLLALTNGNADLAATGLARWFGGSVGARDCGVAKPDARIFQAACARLQLPPEAVLHIGDDWRLDIAGARAAGLHSAWVRRPDAADRSAAALHNEQAPHAAGLQGLHLQVSDLQALADALGA
ncbi:MAG: hypothetical protein RJA44_1496 [Pseudomonadota bacterium]